MNGNGEMEVETQYRIVYRLPDGGLSARAGVHPTLEDALDTWRCCKRDLIGLSTRGFIIEETVSGGEVLSTRQACEV